MSPGRDADSTSLVGAVLENAYRLNRLIGEGGMGTVYEATQLRLGKRVAVKVMARDLAANREALARFRREAEVTSQLGHPHIVHVFDFGTAPAGESYLVMEYLEGEDLEHRVHRAGRLSLTATLHIVKQVASALGATHSKGIVHRDLKPANIFLLEIEGENDFVKVVDFGISKVRAGATKLTRGSVVMGTPQYMSPEQASGKVDDIDHRTDQWALACIAWETLSGHGPFVGEDVASLLYQVIHQEPSPLVAKVPGLPPEIEVVLRKALAKKSTQRFATVAAFARAFADAAGARTADLVPPPQPVRPVKETLAYGETVAFDPIGGLMQTPEEKTRFSPAPAFTPLSVPKPGAAAPELKPQPTTFSRTAGEITGPMKRLTLFLRNKPRWQIGAAAGGVAALILFVALASRSDTSPKKMRPSATMNMRGAAAGSGSAAASGAAPLPATPSITAIPPGAPLPSASQPDPFDTTPAEKPGRSGDESMGTPKRSKARVISKGGSPADPSGERPAVSRPLQAPLLIQPPPAPAKPAKPAKPKRRILMEL